ncbi:N-6 DNA Methylase [delta proteobacterium NaphS2]|nr:N-6 DNA Methylase [delta proteobacterium NaphS2]
MSSVNALKSLGYDRSPNFNDCSGIEATSSSRFSHIYRKAVKYCGLQGVYLLNDNNRNTEVPVVFYCKAENEDEANSIHQRVWNQDVAPFVLVETPAMLRLYCGFKFRKHGGDDRSRGILDASIAFNEVADRLNALCADSIDNGKIWDVWGTEITSNTRVDWTLLNYLKDLEHELVSQGMNRGLTHALIGKFVYLRYLRDRNILSDRKLFKWNIAPENVFSRKPTLEAFKDVNCRLNDWLNGAIFPLPLDAISSSQLELIAGVFSGDTPQGQLHFDFQAYDFSYIPIETLSIIYEQFLHSSEEDGTTKGKKAGAYYTPLPLVNFVLNELETRYPLVEGMRTLDPSCGSGAFLVQCYRALVEKRLAKNGSILPTELSELLVRHIFGVDRDGDACRVAEMSLLLTLLDYTDPPDLENNPRFKLPVLRGSNIFEADFFDPSSKWVARSNNLSFHWLVGNPPWREFNSKNQEDRDVREWATQHADSCPVGGNQIAEAFVWKSLPLLNESAVAGIVLPAMTLFKFESANFRKQFFRTVRAWCVANFSNLAYVLFSGRAELPAMTLFFSPETESGVAGEHNDKILTFAPFVVNQKANRSTRERSKRDTWSIVVSGSELSEISVAKAATGEMRPWKLAMWGTFRDEKLLRRIERRFPSLKTFLKSKGLTQPHQGFELRDPTESDESVEAMPYLAGKMQIDFSKLRNCGRIFAFPDRAVARIPPHLAFLRKRGGEAGLKISAPPHIIVDAARRFAIYSDQFIAVPPRQIGISGPESSKKILKTLSLYLASDFAIYHQFFTTPAWGISTSQATLAALKNLPVPIAKLSETELSEWAELYDALAKQGIGGKAISKDLLDEVNKRVIQILGLRDSEMVLIGDFVNWNMRTIKGKVPRQVTAAPNVPTMKDYLYALKSELDDFVGNQKGIRHSVEAMHDAGVSAFIAISLKTDAAFEPSVFRADESASESLAKTREHLLKQHSQWLYFDRNLRIYADKTMYMFKPMERIQWTRRQAILDAGEIIVETLEQQSE